MEHSEGPWEYFKADNFCGFAIAPKGKLPILCAVDLGLGGHDWIKIRDQHITVVNYPKNTEANAKLMAASPTLLKACKMALNDIRAAVKAMLPDWNEDGPLKIKTVEILKQAIKEAILED